MKRLIEALAKHPAVRFGLPVAAIPGCVMLFLFGISYFGAPNTMIAMGVLLMVAGYFCSWRAFGVVVGLSAVLILTAGPSIAVPRVQWDQEVGEPGSWLYHHVDDPGPAQLRAEYGLDNVVLDAEDELERVAALAGWVNRRWSHSRSNTPSEATPLVILQEAAAGASFRCVEYSVAMAGAAQALGMPTRVLGLKTRWASTARVGAGHVVTEVWLDSFGKWVVADAQFGYVFTVDGVPLSAVELGQALARRPGSIEVLAAAGPVNWLQSRLYYLFVAPYLFHFDAPSDQRVFLSEHERLPGRMMLHPVGSPELTRFQRHFSLDINHYTSAVQAFYASP